MNELKIFSHNDFGGIRALTIDGQPWFVGKDIAIRDSNGLLKTREVLLEEVAAAEKENAQKITEAEAVQKAQNKAMQEFDIKKQISDLGRLEEAHEKLAKGQALSQEEMLALIALYPEFAKRLNENVDGVQGPKLVRHNYK